MPKEKKQPLGQKGETDTTRCYLASSFSCQRNLRLRRHCGCAVPGDRSWSLTNHISSSLNSPKPGFWLQSNAVVALLVSPENGFSHLILHETIPRLARPAALGRMEVFAQSDLQETPHSVQTILYNDAYSGSLGVGFRDTRNCGVGADFRRAFPLEPDPEYFLIRLHADAEIVASHSIGSRVNNVAHNSHADHRPASAVAFWTSDARLHKSICNLKPSARGAVERLGAFSAHVSASSGNVMPPRKGMPTLLIHRTTQTRLF